MSSAKIFTVGGDLNQYRPELWARSVLRNLAVVKAKLTRISDLLTEENFPEMQNIKEKQNLLASAIFAAEQEAIFMQNEQKKSYFFQKKPATFKLTVTHMKCKGHGKGEPGGNSEYYGKLIMGFFGANDQKLKGKNCFNKAKKNHIDLAKNQTRDINKSLQYRVSAANIAKGYVSVYGNLKEADVAVVQLSTVSKHEGKTKIYFRNALDHDVRKVLTFTSKYGDKVEVHYVLKRI